MVRIPIKGPPTHPGEMLLEEFLKPLGMSQTDPAERIGVSYPRINQLIRGQRGLRRVQRSALNGFLAWKPNSAGSICSWPRIFMICSIHPLRRKFEKLSVYPGARQLSTLTLCKLGSEKVSLWLCDTLITILESSCRD
jgi:hypothetical protein